MESIIQTTAELEAACERARQAGVLALDTEFVWKRTYRPQLGIVQVGVPGGSWAIDCMRAIDTRAFRAVVEDSAVVKILHDARQDLMHIRHWTGATPTNVFDTQLAAGFADWPGNMGLQKLLFEAIDVGLAKTETLTDWTQRPLSPAQVKYALDDVNHLPRLREELVARCEQLGTLAWMLEEQQRYDGDAFYAEHEPDEMWKRVKMHGARLDSRGFAILRAVAALRERTAEQWNMPKAWLGDDDSLVAMAERRQLGRLAHRLRGGQGDTMRALYAKAIREALEVPDEECPEDPKRHYIAEVREAADEAMAWLEEKAAALHVAAGIIASRAVVTAYVDDVDDATNPLASGWRFEAVGAEMAERFGVD